MRYGMRRIASILFGFCGVAAVAYAAESAAPWRSLGDKAPEINVDFVQGDPITLAQNPGTHVFVIEFWATWCAPCRYTAPHLSELQSKYTDQGLVVIGISGETDDLVRPYVEKMGAEMSYRVATDRARTTASRFFEGFGRDETLPTAYVIDGNSRVAWIGNPANPFMDTLIGKLVADLPRVAAEAKGAAANQSKDGASK